MVSGDQKQAFQDLPDRNRICAPPVWRRKVNHTGLGSHRQLRTAKTLRVQDNQSKRSRSLRSELQNVLKS